MRQWSRWTRTVAVAGSAALLTLGLASCGGDTSSSGSSADPTGTETTSDSSGVPTTSPSGSPTATTGDEMRDAIIAAMTGVSPTVVRLASNEATTVKTVPAAALTGWRVVDLSLEQPPRPQRVYVGLSEDGLGVVLSNAPDSFARLTEGAEVSSAAEATELAAAYVESTRDPSRLAYPVTGVDDIRWLPRPDTDEKTQIADVKAQFANRIGAPSGVAEGDGYSVMSWWVDTEQLVRHETAVSATGTVTDRRTVEVDNLPVVIGR